MRTQSPSAWFAVTTFQAVALAALFGRTYVAAQESASVSNIAQLYTIPVQELEQGRSVRFRTTVLYSDLEFDIDIGEDFFSLRNLRARR